MVTNKQLNDCRESGCLAILADKKYIRGGDSFIKRTLRRHEWQSTDNGALVTPPASYPQRWKNDAAVLRYLSDKTRLPLPRLQCTYEDDGAFIHCTEYVEGVIMEDLDAEDKEVVMEELLQHLATLKSLRSDTPGVPGERFMCPPQRVIRQWKPHSCWQPRTGSGDYVFCHNDLRQNNVIVDSKTLRIKAILDWEFGGFWPEWYELHFWEEQEPEEDDVDRCRQWLLENCDEVLMPHLEGVTERTKKLVEEVEA